MLRSEKPQVVENLEEVCKQSSSIIVTHYHGLTVSQINLLRKSLKTSDSKFKVVKNTLMKIASTKMDLNDSNKLFSGPTAIAYSEDPIAAAKTVVDFVKTNSNLKIIGGIVNNQVLDEKAIIQLSKLPSLNELRGKIIGLLQAPATKIARVLESPASKIVLLLQAYSNKN